MTPDNAGYYHAAYVATAIIYVAYAASVWWRGVCLARKEQAGGGAGTESRDAR